MKPIAWIAGLAVAASITACAGRPAQVPVSAAPGTSGAALVGEWSGEYQSPQTGRGGSIVFHLDAGRDTAEGDVVMVPRGGAGPLRPAPAASTAQPGAMVGASQPTALTIRFVRLEGDRVTGQLAPYTDPECTCPVFTVFEGTVRGGRITGTFITRGEPGGTPATGTWRADRTAP
jgi:hypothetical protein